jgi:hypothetical protein
VAARAAAPKQRLPSRYRFSWRALPRDLKLLSVGVVAVLLLGLGFLFVPRVPWQSKPAPPLLGWSEPQVPRPTPTPRAGKARPTPSPTAAQKKSWWPF